MKCSKNDAEYEKAQNTLRTNYVSIGTHRAAGDFEI